MKNIWMLGAVLAFALRASGQTTSTYNTGIGHGQPLIPTAQADLPKALSPVAITWDYYAQPKTLIVHALNNSGKDISGYTILIRYKNPDGTIDKGGRTEYTTDMLSVLITTQMAKDPAVSERIRLESTVFNAPGNGIFVAGETRDMTLPGIDSGSEIDITYGAVFYTDTTFDEQDADAFKRLLANRQGELLVIRKTNEAVKNALADPANEHPASAAIAELTKAAIEAATHKADGPYDPEQNLQWSLQSAIQNLRNVQQQQVYGEQKGKTERERLAQYVEEQEKRIELMTPHCHLEITVSQDKK
jgi:hypothetical protein